MRNVTVNDNYNVESSGKCRTHVQFANDVLIDNLQEDSGGQHEDIQFSADFINNFERQRQRRQSEPSSQGQRLIRVPAHIRHRRMSSFDTVRGSFYPRKQRRPTITRQSKSYGNLFYPPESKRPTITRKSKSHGSILTQSEDTSEQKIFGEEETLWDMDLDKAPPIPPRTAFSREGSLGSRTKKKTISYGSLPLDKDVTSAEVSEHSKLEDEEKEQNKGFLYDFDPNVFLSGDLVDEVTREQIYKVPSFWVKCIRFLLYNPEEPEHTSLQQFNWAVIIGILMGIYTAIWKELIEFSVELVWKSLPEYLYNIGVFTDMHGAFPLPNFMWMCPSLFGGILSYISAMLPIPTQDDWIQNIHTMGVQDHKTFVPLFLIATAGISSGLSLGPELPLILTSGMIGSLLATKTRQSVLSSRAMNLTAGSAAISGFFGFPMAGGLFILELPHRMGLQYFEALSPATISSIVAVIFNRIIVNNDVTGYYKYPYLEMTLPSEIFYIAIVYGLVGSILGILYLHVVKTLKMGVHGLFHHDHHDEVTDSLIGNVEQEDVERCSEESPLVHNNSSETNQKGSFRSKFGELAKKVLSFGQIRHEPTRAGVSGAIDGFLVGLICMFVPHVTFWGEAQLQHLIVRGKMPLPIFGKGDEITSDLTGFGLCMIDPATGEQLTSRCGFLIAISKIIVTGLSLGTGIVGGHFWGPLFVGCAASHLVTDVLRIVSETIGFGKVLYMYPCVAIICIMGSTHVVPFRAHTAIMLILTLTISEFDPIRNRKGKIKEISGDYSAIFPLLVVSCFVALMLTRNHSFYKTQRCRGDIMASPEVLCEPGKSGQPMVLKWDEAHTISDESSSSHDEEERPQPIISMHDDNDEESSMEEVVERGESKRKMFRPSLERIKSGYPALLKASFEDGLDEQLLDSSPPTPPKRGRHRRANSDPSDFVFIRERNRRLPDESTLTSTDDSVCSSRDERSFRHIESYGQLSDFHPPLFEQARKQAATRLRMPMPSSTSTSLPSSIRLGS